MFQWIPLLYSLLIVVRKYHSFTWKIMLEILQISFLWFMKSLSYSTNFGMHPETRSNLILHFPLLFLLPPCFQRTSQFLLSRISEIFFKICIYHHGWEKNSNLWRSDLSKIHFQNWVQIFLLGQVLTRFLTSCPRKRESYSAPSRQCFCENLWPSRKRGSNVCTWPQY